MKYIIAIAASLSLFLACSKDEPINLTSACEKGDRWMINTTDTFSGIDSSESFTFVQGGGYHTFYWTRSALNSLTISLDQLPKVNETIYYKKAFVRDFKCTYKGVEFSYSNPVDSVIMLTHKGTHFELKVNSIKLGSVGSSDIQFRACDLLMSDTNP